MLPRLAPHGLHHNITVAAQPKSGLVTAAKSPVVPSASPIAATSTSNSAPGVAVTLERQMSNSVPGVAPTPERQMSLTVNPAAASAALLSALQVELRTTEETFVEDLRCMSTRYLQPLRANTRLDARAAPPR